MLIPKILCKPWIWKYIPLLIKHLCIHPKIESKLSCIKFTKKIPNLLITGLSGLGKTSTGK